MNPLEDGLHESLKRWTDRHVVELFPGLALVTAILEYFAKQLKQEGAREDPRTWLYLLVAALLIYVFGNAWDELLFDPLFSVADPTAGWLKRMWRSVLTPVRWLAQSLRPAKRLQDARLKAGETLNEQRATCGDFSGLHKTAATLIMYTREWKEEVEPWLHRSKAARSFLLPFLSLAVFRYRWPDFPWPFPESVLSRLWVWQWDAALFVLALVAYLWLRSIHMRRLYELIRTRTSEQAGESIYAAYRIARRDVPYLDTPTAVQQVGSIQLLPGSHQLKVP